MRNAPKNTRKLIPVMVGLILILLWGTSTEFVSAQAETSESYPPLTGIVAISAESTGSTCALTESGGVECWGEAGGTGASNILKITDAVALASGGQHSCVITRSGGMQCWGYNSNGQLGDETTEYSSYTAVDVKGLPGKVSALAGGFSFTCAVAAGEVWCWGENDYGQLGDGTTTDQYEPVKVVGLAENILAIAAGTTHACALNTNGGVQCWGGHIGSVLGNSSLDTPSAPVSISGLETGVVMIASRMGHSCALKQTGDVVCWGMNESGQLGSGEASFASDSPVQVRGLPANVSEITAGVEHSCAFTSDGKIYCWGDNRAGELGDGSNEDRLTPVAVNGLRDKATSIAAGRDYTCAIVDGGVQCWGENQTDQLGAAINTDSDIPVNVDGLTGASALAAGGDTSCAVTNDGGVQCWGENEFGQVGDGTDVDQSRPRDVQGIHGQIASLSIGISHTCALLNDGSIQCWGSNLQGKLGTEAVDYKGSKTAISVSSLPGKATTVSAGNDHSCTVIQNSVYCWGGNTYGQLGDGTTETHNTPTALSDLRGNATAVSAGFNYTCALTDGGAVLCWGYNQYGQLGDGTTEDRSTPIAVTGLNSGNVSVAAGEDHTCALTNTGGVKCWGNNTFGQLGNGTTEDSLTPVDVSGLAGKAVVIATDHDLSCALLDTGGVQCWGNGSHVGSGDSFGSIATPTNVSGLSSGVRAIAVGRFHACALLEAGSIQCWGTNWNGQLGNGAGPDSSTPLTVVLGPRNEEEVEAGGFRESGPLVPVITTYIPTPLDVSTQPRVIGTNLLLAALLMLPFAVAAELFTRILGEHEADLRKKFRPVDWISRLQKRLDEFTGTRFSKRPALRDTLKLIGVIIFYGLVFSLLDRTWKPFSLQGLTLFISMTIAYGVVGIADDIIQWRTIRKWGLHADLTVRPTNFLLAMASTTTSRMLSMVPGLMFGTPEALQTEEGQFDEQKRNSLLKISAITFVVIGLTVWLPTIATAAIQRLALPENALNLIGGLEGFLLVIFAVTLENLFVQMLGFPGGFGQALKRRSKWMWLAVLSAVTFLFYHTLINPRGELAEAVQESNVVLFFGIAIAFMLVAFGLHFYFNRRERARAVSTGSASRTETRPLVEPRLESHQPIESPVAPSPIPLSDVERALIVIPLGENKRCPVCGETIKAEAKLCRFCRTTFSVAVKGYCPESHEIVDVTEDGKCVLCGREPKDVHIESRLLNASAAILPKPQPSPIAVLEGGTSSRQDEGETKQCPTCGQTIKAEALICRFCRARFEVRTRGYCLADHAVVDVKDGKCVQCGDEAKDVHFESRLVEGTTPNIKPVSRSHIPVSAVPVTTESATKALAPRVSTARTPFWQIYLSPKGRVGRLTFFVKGILPVLGLLGLTLFILMALTDSVNASGSSGAAEVLISIGMIVLLVGMLFLYWVLLVLIIKRLHDLARSGWNMLLWLIPLAGQFINLWNWIEFLFVKGTAGPNKFGNHAD